MASSGSAAVAPVKAPPRAPPLEVESRSEDTPHPNLTKLTRATPGRELNKEDLFMHHEEARAVLFMMKSRQGFFCNVAPTARVQFPYIAAALAIMCGYFRKKNKKPNYCAAAAAFGMWTQHPVSVRDWVTCLSLLEKGIEMAADEEDWRYMAWQHRRDGSGSRPKR